MALETVYLIGSLRNPNVPALGSSLRKVGYEVFDDWHAAGPEADDHWQSYEQGRGNSYGEALNNYAARNIFEFDQRNLDRSDIAVLLMPAGKSGHLELGYMLGKGKEGYVVFDKEPERWDVMYQFANDVFFSDQDFLVYMFNRIP
jgi:nucleoside 2-deoxyribosyltransferase